MGTRINVLFGHTLSDHADTHEVTRQLERTIPAALAVDDYWVKQDEEHSPTQTWTQAPIHPRDRFLRRYDGPGSLFLTLTPVAAALRTGGRWRGFLSIEPLRQVHLAAFHAVAASFGAERMALFPDSDYVDDLFWDGQAFESCIVLLRREWGPPQQSIENVHPDIVAETEHGVLFVWFLESVTPL
jgi:hypothetical protein